MKYGMAVRTDGNEILFGIDHTSSVAQRQFIYMMNLDHVFADWTVEIAHQEAADLTGATMVGQASLSGFRISLDPSSYYGRLFAFFESLFDQCFI